MRILLDSHFCFWLALRRDRLSAAELAVILDPDNEIAFPSVAIWELSIKWDKRFVSGMRKGEANPGDVLRTLHAIEILAIDLTSEMAAAELLVEPPHRDPFDRLLLTIAQETDRKLLTRDEQLRRHPLAFHAD